MIAYFYSETGFNSVDIPDSLELVKNEGNLVLRKTNINIIQTDNIYKLTIKGMVRGIARGIDYVIISDNGEETGYFIDDKGYEFRSPDTCTFYLQLDPYATMGGLVRENEIVSGTANRMTVNESEEDNQWFTLTEPFKPSLRPLILEAILDGRMNIAHQDVNLLETLVIPPKTLKDAEVSAKYNTGTDYNGVNISVPSQIPMPPRTFDMSSSNQEVVQSKENVGGQQRITSTTVNDVQVFEYRDLIETNLTIKGLYGDNKTIKTGSRWWKQDQLEGTATFSGKTKKTTVINDLRITGSDANIVNYWSVPQPYIESADGTSYQPQEATNYGGINNIASSLDVSDDNHVINTSYEAFNLKNNKAKYGQGTQVIVYNPVTGNRLEKQWSEVIDPSIMPSANLYKAPFKIGADIRPSGNPIFAFQYLNGKSGDVQHELWGYCYGEILNGGNWRQIPISGQGTNNALSQLALNQEKKENRGASLGMGLMGVGQVIIGALGVATGMPTSGMIGTGVQTTLEAVGGYIANNQKQKNQQELLNAQGQMPSANLQYSNSNYVRELGYNTFYVRYLMYAEEDLKAFDRFLTLYGYNVGNKKIVSGDFDSRPGFNYMRVNDIDIISDKGVWLVERVKEQLKAGVRIWHELPNSTRVIQGNR